jgi:hypothetical protein
MAKKFSLEWWQSQRPEVVGKETEKLVEDVMNQWNRNIGFAWLRFPDSKAARGIIKAQPADMLFVQNGTPYFLEVKALKHPYRLPASRVSQLPTLKKFNLAGAEALILIHHYMEGNWRIVNASDIDLGQPSWDLRSEETFTHAHLALESML